MHVCVHVRVCAVVCVGGEGGGGRGTYVRVCMCERAVGDEPWDERHINDAK